MNYDPFLDKPGFVKLLIDAGLRDSEIEQEYAFLSDLFVQNFTALCVNKLPENVIQMVKKELNLKDAPTRTAFFERLLDYISDKKNNVDVIEIVKSSGQNAYEQYFELLESRFEKMEKI